jgi:hypothetical protein
MVGIESKNLEKDFPIINIGVYVLWIRIRTNYS